MRLFPERSAWRTSTYINSVLGFDDSKAGIWTKGTGWNSAKLEEIAIENAAYVCFSIPGGCTP